MSVSRRVPIEGEREGERGKDGEERERREREGREREGERVWLTTLFDQRE